MQWQVIRISARLKLRGFDEVYKTFLGFQMKRNQQYLALTAFIALNSLFVALLSACASKPVVNPDEVSLNTAIRQAASRMEMRLDAGTKVALINFTSPSQAFSEYVLDELSSVLVNGGMLVVVDRANLDKIRQELGFNTSGEVSDASMQQIGEMLGAQALVTGSLASIGDLQRVMFKVIMTETATVTVQHPADIINDQRVKVLLASGGGSQGLSYGGTSSGRGTQTAGASGGGSSSGNQAATGDAIPARTAAVVYKIGDTGPAGGLIFYDKGNNIGGWRYLEAAPADIGPSPFLTENPDSFPKNLKELWDRTDGESGRGIDKGKYNTEYLMEAAQARGGFNWAVRLCDNYEHNGFNDWFLPSRDELNFMYGNLYLRGLGNFRQEQYWSSTTWTDTWGSYRAWYVNFNDGTHDTQNAGQQRRSRPVRQF